MASSSSVRIDDDLYASAQLVGEALGRSASQQVGHWVRIGRELEASALTSQRAVAAVLAGVRRYDTLRTQEQVIVRAEWSGRMGERRAALDLAAEFAASGAGCSELDDDGNLVRRPPTAPGG